MILIHLEECGPKNAGEIDRHLHDPVTKWSRGQTSRSLAPLLVLGMVERQRQGRHLSYSLSIKGQEVLGFLNTISNHHE